MLDLVDNDAFVWGISLGRSNFKELKATQQIKPQSEESENIKSGLLAANMRLCGGRRVARGPGSKMPPRLEIKNVYSRVPFSLSTSNGKSKRDSARPPCISSSASVASQKLFVSSNQ